MCSNFVYQNLVHGLNKRIVYVSTFTTKATVIAALVGFVSQWFFNQYYSDGGLTYSSFLLISIGTNRKVVNRSQLSERHWYPSCSKRVESNGPLSLRCSSVWWLVATVSFMAKIMLTKCTQYIKY